MAVHQPTPLPNVLACAPRETTPSAHDHQRRRRDNIVPKRYRTGGQKINKTNSAVQIIHKPSGVVVKCQATRSQSQNEKIARHLLADKVEAREKGEDSRAAMKAEAARKKKASKMKKSKRKYRDLSEGKNKDEDEDRMSNPEGEEGIKEEKR
ncbi:Peptide chain release factor class I/class II [Penicillium lagena]|uniref:Peptide chain release factor class I/class II n=1 Tax=Penicillium lagena TaxID=94218 RepID=UPI00253F86BF|nr:Peptide chain release factor class I/class II [Penicillium lagena]KAJ5612688.1 Peptide chain release factor class I/class II [Penicillium lagena]